MRALTASLLATLALSTPLAAQGERAPAPRPVVMLCELIDESHSGWVPEFVMLTRQASGRIEVFDTILHQLIGKPIQAQITQDSRRSRTYGWALAGVRNGSGQWAERMDFRLELRKADGTVTMQVTVAGFDNTMQGQGQCITPTR